MKTRTVAPCAALALAGSFGISTLLGASAVHADDTALEEVTVTANRLEEELPQELSKYGVRVDTISAAQIKDGGYSDIAQVLQALAPGLYISAKNGPFDYVDASLQGSQTGDILWLVDGVRINNRLYNGTTPLDTLPASMVERIEILEGGEALFYGTQAVAGAVNIVTKSFTDHLDGNVSVAADTQHDQHADAYARDALGRLQWVLYASADSSTGYEPFRKQDYQPSDTDRDRAFNMMTVGAKLAYNFTDDVRLSATEQHSQGRVDDTQTNTVYKAYNNRDEDLLTGKLDAKISDEAQLFIKAYDHLWRSHYTEYDNTIPVGGPISVSDNHDPWGYKDYGVNLLSQLKLGPDFDSFVGYDLQNYSGKDAVLVIAQHTEHTQAVFGQLRTTDALVPNLKLAAGVRYNDPSDGESATVWNFNGRYNFTSYAFIRGQIGTSFRLPTAEELFANDPEDERGDPNIKPEKSFNANVSVGGAGQADQAQWHWELIGFYRSIRDLIDYTSFDATTDQDVFGNLPGTVHERGAELSLDASWASMLSANLNYTYNHAVDADGDALERIPHYLIKLGLDWHPAGQPWGASATLTRTGNILATSLWDGTESYGDTTVVDVSARYFIDSAHHHRLDLSVKNIFNLEYASRLGTGTRDDDGSNYTVWDLGLPRTVRLGYTYSF